jgi:hypothetical protein
VDHHTHHPPKLFLTTSAQARLLKVIKAGKALNCKALTCLWTTSDKKEEQTQADQARAWTHSAGWESTVGQITNKQQDGCLEGRSTCLITANKGIIDRLLEQFDKSNDGCHCVTALNRFLTSETEILEIISLISQQQRKSKNLGGEEP